MAVKKPSAKATKAKKTVARKPEPKKVAIAKKPPAATTVAARAKPAAKSTTKTSVTTPSTPSKPAAPAQKAPAMELETEGTPAPTPTGKPAAPAKPAASSAPAEKPPAPAAVAARATMSIKPPEPVADNGAGDGEDGEGPEVSGTNLLAGPRNVKPYIPRRGEQYMGKEQLEHFRQILNSWKRDLMQEVDRTVLHMKDEAANFPDPNDRATQESEFSLELRTRDRERKLIRKIDEAIKRIEDGSYGYCVETGEEIGIKRLEARPVATLCVEAQERRERREKQYGDRDDRYR
jgi:DnaK suppressor protein